MHVSYFHDSIHGLLILRLQLTDRLLNVDLDLSERPHFDGGGHHFGQLSSLHVQSGHSLLDRLQGALSGLGGGQESSPQLPVPLQGGLRSNGGQQGHWEVMGVTEWCR